MAGHEIHLERCHVQDSQKNSFEDTPFLCDKPCDRHKRNSFEPGDQHLALKDKKRVLKTRICSFEPGEPFSLTDHNFVSFLTKESKEASVLCFNCRMSNAFSAPPPCMRIHRWRCCDARQNEAVPVLPKAPGDNWPPEKVERHSDAL